VFGSPHVLDTWPRGSIVLKSIVGGPCYRSASPRGAPQNHFTGLQRRIGRLRRAYGAGLRGARAHDRGPGGKRARGRQCPGGHSGRDLGVPTVGRTALAGSVKAARIRPPHQSHDSSCAGHSDRLLPWQYKSAINLERRELDGTLQHSGLAGRHRKDGLNHPNGPPEPVVQTLSIGRSVANPRVNLVRSTAHSQRTVWVRRAVESTRDTYARE
jgi:hypothetical protein